MEIKIIALGKDDRPLDTCLLYTSDTLKRIVIAADELGIKVLTVYAFSTENWKRPEEEVSYIMKLMKNYLSHNLLQLKEHNVQLHIIGDKSRLHPELQEAFAQAESDMAANRCV